MEPETPTELDERGGLAPLRRVAGGDDRALGLWKSLDGVAHGPLALAALDLVVDVGGLAGAELAERRVAVADGLVEAGGDPRGLAQRRDVGQRDAGPVGDLPI